METHFRLEDIAGDEAERIVLFALSENKTSLHVEEECDNYFSVDLTKEQVKRLIDRLALLYFQMPD